MSVALPMYTRAIERSRATEAMSAIKALNDSVYAYFTERETGPVRFSQLVVTLPDANTDDEGDIITTKFFQFDLAGAPVPVPGTDGRCNGVLATRINGGGTTGYNYSIWHPYTRGSSGDSLALQCDGTNDKSIAVCESLGLYRGEEATEELSEEEEGEQHSKVGDNWKHVDLNLSNKIKEEASLIGEEKKKI